MRSNEALAEEQEIRSRIEMSVGWYIVWYWLDDEHFTHKKFSDYQDAYDFAKEKYG